jgi:sec-independent protein translocase protein TatA
MTPLFGMPFFGIGEWIVIGIIAVLLFGKRLPDMAKYIGKSVVEFKKGMHGLESGFDDVANPHPAAPAAAPTSAPVEAIRPPQRVAPAAPKFDDAPAPVNTHVTANPPQP